MVIELRDDRLAEVVETSATIERLMTGFGFTEGPVWHGPDAVLVFSDIPNSRMYRWHDGDRAAEVFRDPSDMANGNTYDSEWRLVTCEHATSRVTRTEHDGQIRVLADKYGADEFNSPNDIVVKSDGSLYFTDPTFGRQEFFGVPRPLALSYSGVYRLGSDGRLDLLLTDFVEPNGLCFSPDEKQLYVNDTAREHIRVFAVREDGTLTGGGLFATITGTGDGSPDGMKTDVDGRVYCTGPGGVHIFDQAGICLGVIRLPEVVGNFTWGGVDRTDLYVCASTSLYRIAVSIPGNVR